MKQRIFSLLLVLALVFSLLPMGAMAKETPTSGSCGKTLTWELSAEGTLTISGSGYMTDYKDAAEVPWSADAASIKAVSLPEELCSVGDNAFAGCTAVSSVTLPHTLVEVGEKSFAGCTGLKELYFLGGCPTFAEDSFEGVTATAFYPNGDSTWKKDSRKDYGGKLTWIAYAPTGTCGENITWTLTKGGVLTLTGVGKMTDYLYTDSAPWNALRDSIKTVVLSEGITHVGAMAFACCSKLETLTLPSSTMSIGRSAFAGCNLLASVIIPKNVSVIGADAFAACLGLTAFELDKANTSFCVIDGVLFNSDKTVLLCYPAGKAITYTVPEGVVRIANNAFSQSKKLKGVTLPKGLTHIGDNAFAFCDGLMTVKLPETLTYLGESAFHLCSKLKSIEIPKGITAIGLDTFSSCAALTDVKLPEGLTAIGNYAFYRCEALENVKLPESVTKLGAYSFALCSKLGTISLSKALTEIGEQAFSEAGLTEFRVAEENPNFAAVDGVLMNKAQTKLMYFPTLRTDAYTVPATVTELGDGSFSGAKLAAITLSDSVAHIGASAFFCCKSLIAVTMGSGVKEIGPRAFSGCAALSSLVLGENLEQIGESAFAGCNFLGYVVLPANVKQIDENAFAECVNLKDAYFMGDAPTIGKAAFERTIDDGAAVATALLHVREDKTGWTIPAWNGYATAPWRTAPFVDLLPEQYYVVPVQWAAEKNITKGMTPYEFWPDASCTRGQVVTFLWRAAGSPKVSVPNPFGDVSETAFFYDAVIWAVSTGITTGTSQTTFSPEMTVTRGQFVTFLYRYAGEPTVTGTGTFTDVDANAYYAPAVKWAVDAGVTNGISEKEFWPDAPCTRGQTVTFLFRNLIKEEK